MHRLFCLDGGRRQPTNQWHVSRALTPTTPILPFIDSNYWQESVFKRHSKREKQEGLCKRWHWANCKDGSMQKEGCIKKKVRRRRTTSTASWLSLLPTFHRCWRYETDLFRLSITNTEKMRVACAHGKRGDMLTVLILRLASRRRFGVFWWLV